MRQSFKIFFIGIFLLGIFNPVIADEIAQNYYDLGVFAYEERNFTESQDLLLKAISLDPENARINFYLGRVYLELEQLDVAAHYLSKAFLLNPQIPGLTYSLGILYQEKKAGCFINSI